METAMSIAMKDMGALIAAANSPQSAIDELKADITQRAINVMYPPAPLVAAVGDGESDDSPAVKGVIEYLRMLGGGVVFCPMPPNFYSLHTKISLYSNITLQGANKGVIIDGSGLGSTLASQRTFIEAAGSAGDSILLSGNVSEGATSVTVANADELAVGDWVLIGSDGLIEYQSSYNANKGEIKKIRTIADTTIAFEDNLFDSYLTADNAFVKKITFVENVAIRDLTIRGTDSPNGETTIRLTYCSNPIVENTNIHYADIYQILVDSCIYTKVSSCHMEGTYYDGVTGINFYGVCVLNSSQWTTVINNSSNELRHLFVCTANSSGLDRWGQPLFIDVLGNHAHNCNNSYAYEHHGFGRFVNIIGNTGNDCYSGVSIEGPDVIVSNNQFYDISNTGIRIGDGKSIENVIIEGNKFNRCAGTGILVNATADYLIDKVKINDNVINLSIAADGIRVSQYASHVSIEGNELFGQGGTVGFGVYNAAPKSKITGNTLSNFAAGIANVGAKPIIEGNLIESTTNANGINNSGANASIKNNMIENTASNNAIMVSAKSNICGNTIDGTTSTWLGISAAAGSSESVINDNTFIGIGGYCIGVNNAVNDCIIMGNMMKGNTNKLSIGTGTGHIYQTAAGDKYNRD